MNNKPCFSYLFSEIIANGKLNGLAPITEEHCDKLITDLFNNAIEQISKIKNINKIIISPDNVNSLIPNDLSSQFKQVKYSLEENILNKLNELLPAHNGRYLILWSNTIGYSSEDIQRVFDLLLDDGETLVIGKTNNNRICFVGTNFWDAQFLDHLSASKFQFDDLLKRIKRKNINYFVLNGYLKIEDLNDFKKLYTLLSNRISEKFCSENIHEKFTNLFIEYKELL